MQKFRLKTSEVGALQLNWKNWHEMCGFLGDIISERNPARSVEGYRDDCGEIGPFIELTVFNQHIEAVDGPKVTFTAKHGDWIVGESGDFYVISPKAFERIFELVN